MILLQKKFSFWNFLHGWEWTNIIMENFMVRWGLFLSKWRSQYPQLKDLIQTNPSCYVSNSIALSLNQRLVWYDKLQNWTIFNWRAFHLQLDQCTVTVVHIASVLKCPIISQLQQHRILHFTILMWEKAPQHIGTCPSTQLLNQHSRMNGL